MSKTRARAFTGFVVEDIVAVAQDSGAEAKYGLDKPNVIATFWYEDGETVKKVALHVGTEADDKSGWYVKAGDRPWIYRARSGHMLTSLRATPDDLAAPAQTPPAPDGG